MSLATIDFVYRNIYASGGRVPSRSLERQISSLEIGGFLLATAYPPPTHATYVLSDGASYLGNGPGPDKEHTEARTHIQEQASQAMMLRSTLNTLAFSPSEITLMQLHAELATTWPCVPCSRFLAWDCVVPTSRNLDSNMECSMSLRFLQHYLDTYN